MTFTWAQLIGIHSLGQIGSSVPIRQIKENITKTAKDACGYVRNKLCKAIISCIFIYISWCRSLEVFKM